MPRKEPFVASAGVARPLTVLMGEDTLDLQVLIASWLEQAGHRVATASTGREVVQRTAERPFDLLVTDILMPDGDGWDAIREVHRLRPATRILAISGGAREIPASAVLRIARGAGAIGLLPKPFSRPEFFEAIGRVMTQRAS